MPGFTKKPLTGLLLAACSLAPFCASCASLQVPLTPPSFTREQLVEGGSGSLTVRAKAIAGRNANWELFDDDLPRLGIAAVWVSVRNRSSSEVNLTGLRWRLSVGTQRCDALEPAEVLTRYYKGKHSRFYSVHAHQQARQDLQQASLQLGRLPASIESQGFLFFRIDPQMAGRWSRESALVAEGLPSEGGTEAVLRLPLEYADH